MRKTDEQVAFEKRIKEYLKENLSLEVNKIVFMNEITLQLKLGGEDVGDEITLGIEQDYTHEHGVDRLGRAHLEVR